GAGRVRRPASASRKLREAAPPPPQEQPGRRHGIRLGLEDVHGIAEAEIRAILEARAARPFADVGDFLRRANVSRPVVEALAHAGALDRKSTRLNSSHEWISYAVFCLKKKKQKQNECGSTQEYESSCIP